MRGIDMQGYPQPKTHPLAQQAMMSGTGGLHRPVARPTGGVQPMPRPQPMRPVLRPSAPQVGGSGVQRAAAPQGPSGDVSPQIMQMLLQLPRPQVRAHGPNPQAMGAAVLAHLMQLRGGNR